MPAKENARLGWASAIGASITSGGTGKKIASMKLRPNSSRGACRFRDQAMARA